MAETVTPLPSVQQHADSIMEKIIAERGDGIENTAEARQAASVPTFSTGTAALDKDGKAIVPKKQAKVPEFTEGTVAVPEATGAETITPPEAPASKEAILAAHQARLESAAPAPPAESAQAQATGAAVADEAAAAVADAWAEMDEFEFDDPDLDIKIPVRVPKQYSEIAKRGYGRRAAHDRAIRYLKEADPTLRPLIEDGRLQKILPLLQRALDDPAYGDYVFQGYDRSTKGLPLIEAAKVEATLAAAPPAPIDFGIGDDDPFFAERIAPLQKRLETFEQRFAREDAERTAATERQNQAAAQQRWQNQQMAEAHRDLAQMYQGQYNPTQQINDPMFKRAVDYAREAGYLTAYGLKAGTIFGAQQIAQMESERLAATGSPAAAALAVAEQKNLHLARSEAAAASRTVGGGAPMHAAPAPPPVRPTTMNPDGSMKPPAQYRDEMVRFMEASRVTA